MQHTPFTIKVTRLSKQELCSLIPETAECECFTDIFQKISHTPWALLLDTSGSTQSGGRYNIMAYSPSLVVEAKEGVVSLHDPIRNINTVVDEKPFEAVEQYLHSQLDGATVDTSEDISELPFIIGVAGMAGYDTGRYYESLPSISRSDYQSADFSVGLYLQSLIEDTKTGAFYYCSCDGSTTPDIETLVRAQHERANFALTSPFKSNLTKEAYTQCLSQINNYLRAGDCYQVNMAQRFSATYTGSFWNAYKELRAQNCAPFSAYYNSSSGSIASISPERFLRVKDGVVETKPIKGTRPRFSDPSKDKRSAESLLSAEKDRAENLMIVDLLRNDISKHCKPHSVNVPALFALESYQAVHHLVSTVVGELNESTSPLTLLKSAFPGGSITGAPKIRAMEVIDELEPHRRHIYCGSIFYMGFREDMDSSICIRTLLAENNTLYCWAGGGIVLDSVAQEEYQETFDKVSKIIPVLESLNAN
ncbi:aminodeoxychorismate synthase, component I [Tenacibaculum sp. KUL152]|nr:aminodeoxychorismate synthase, component I [Tenacibaculum sp. KUL152]